MDGVLLFALRIALIAVLWLFILIVLTVLRKDTKATAPAASVAPARPAKRGEVPRHITIVDGPMRGSRLDLDGVSEVTIGRSPDCLFVVSDDYASSRHARLFQHGNEWFVEDLDSRNGTFVNGDRIDQPERVTTASTIKIGRTTVRLIG